MRPAAARFARRFVGPFLSRRFVQFAAVGASGVLVNLACLGLFEHLGVHINVASALAIEVSLLSNFFINHAWTFRDRRDHAGHVLVQALRFHLVCLLGAAVQFAVFVVMNVVWLHTMFEPARAVAYQQGVHGGFQRWIWHPLVDPPSVGRWVYLSQLLGIVGGTAWNYLLNFYWTWAEKDGGARGGPTPPMDRPGGPEPNHQPDEPTERSAHGGR